MLERIRARRTVRPLPKRTVALVLALMLMVCGTAVALTLRYSARFDLIRHARGVLSSTYGLTGQVIDLLTPRLEQDENGWTVRFTSNDWPEHVGEYTVTGSSDGSVQAAWSFDDAVRNEAPGDLTQAIWGPAELQKLLDLRRLDSADYAEGYYNMTLEERAAIDAPLMALAGSGYRINIAPEEGDIQPDEAVSLALRAIEDKYGIDPETFEDFQIGIAFYLRTAEMKREYRISFDNTKLWCDVEIDSPSGEVTYCIMRCLPENFPLPEGDLSRYPQAMKEFVSRGGFEVLSPEDKAAVYQRFRESGISVLLPEGEFITPAPADLDEKSAIDRARKGLMEQLSFPEEAFQLFGIRTAMLRQDEGRVWQIRFIGQSQYYYTNWLLDDNLGDYTVTVAADGRIIGCEWSLADSHEDTHDPAFFGQSEVYASNELSYVLALKEALEEILAKYPPDIYDMDMTHEDRAAIDELMRQAGFSPRIYCYMLPEEGELTEQEAIAQARQVLKDEYGLTDSEMDSARQETAFCMNYYLGDEPIKGWSVAYKGCGPNGQDIYTVFLNAVDGVIEQVVHDDGAIGNG